MPPKCGGLNGITFDLRRIGWQVSTLKECGEAGLGIGKAYMGQNLYFGTVIFSQHGLSYMLAKWAEFAMISSFR
jgi:hypothetical protein